MIYLGRDVASRTWLWGSPENAYLLLAPPRRGKGVSVIIPNLLDWPGPLVATSTKDDLIVHTAFALREERPVYVFDPTGFSEWPAPVRLTLRRAARRASSTPTTSSRTTRRSTAATCTPRRSPDATSPPSGSGSTGRRATMPSGVCATA